MHCCNGTGKWQMDRQMDTILLHRACSAYYVGSANNVAINVTQLLAVFWLDRPVFGTRSGWQLHSKLDRWKSGIFYLVFILMSLKYSKTQHLATVNKILFIKGSFQVQNTGIKRFRFWLGLCPRHSCESTTLLRAVVHFIRLLLHTTPTERWRSGQEISIDCCMASTCRANVESAHIVSICSIWTQTCLIFQC